MFLRVSSFRWAFKKSFPWNRRQAFCFNGCLGKLTLSSLIKQKRKVARWGQRMWRGDHRWQMTQWAAGCVLWPGKQKRLPLGHGLCPAAAGHRGRGPGSMDLHSPPPSSSLPFHSLSMFWEYALSILLSSSSLMKFPLSGMLFFFFFFKDLILFIFGCVGSSLLHAGFL